MSWKKRQGKMIVLGLGNVDFQAVLKEVCLPRHISWNASVWQTLAQRLVGETLDRAGLTSRLARICDPMKSGLRML